MEYKVNKENLLQVIRKSIYRKYPSIKLFSEDVGLQRQYMNKILMGKNTPSIHKLIKICDQLEIDIIFRDRQTEEEIKQIKKRRSN